MAKEKQANPLLAGLVNILPAVVNTVGSLVKNKKNKDKGSSTIMPPLMPDAHNIADGLELSSKVVVGYGLGGVIVMHALGNIDAPHGFHILCIGTILVAITTIAKIFEK